MKKIIFALVVIMVIALLFGGCMLSYGRGSIVETTLTFRNSSDYEIESFGLLFLGSTSIKRINPMEYPIEDDRSLKPGEEREFIYAQNP